MSSFLRLVAATATVASRPPRRGVAATAHRRPVAPPQEGLDASLLDKDLDAPPDAETLRLLNKEAPSSTARQWGGREAKKRASLKPVHCCVEIDQS